jgi:hypothetical protein
MVFVFYPASHPFLDSSHPLIFVWYVTATPGYEVSLTVDVNDVFKFALGESAYYPWHRDKRALNQKCNNGTMTLLSNSGNYEPPDGEKG